MKKRDARLRESWDSNGAKKEARIKAMNDSLERHSIEMKAAFSSWFEDRYNSVSSAQRRAENPRSFNACSALKREELQDDEDLSGLGLSRNIQDEVESRMSPEYEILINSESENGNTSQSFSQVDHTSIAELPATVTSPFPVQDSPGTPAGNLKLKALFPEEPNDLVLNGINLGSNCGYHFFSYEVQLIISMWNPNNLDAMGLLASNKGVKGKGKAPRAAAGTKCFLYWDHDIYCARSTRLYKDMVAGLNRTRPIVVHVLVHKRQRRIIATHVKKFMKHIGREVRHCQIQIRSTSVKGKGSYKALKMKQVAFRHLRDAFSVVFGLSLTQDTVMSDSEDSTVTYTAVSSPFGGLSDIGSPGVDGPPVMPKDPYAYVVAAFQAPPSPDYVPGLKYPPSPDFVPEPVYPEFMPPEDEEDPEEEDDEDLEEDLTDYPADGGDDGDDEDELSDDDKDEDVDIKGDEEEEEHPAPADSTTVTLPAVEHASFAEETEPFETDESTTTPPPHPAYRVTARISIRDELPTP
ncbi:hypothetical protein Tco_0300804 [Tanacetum coccineum]